MQHPSVKFLCGEVVDLCPDHTKRIMATLLCIVTVILESCFKAENQGKELLIVNSNPSIPVCVKCLERTGQHLKM